MPGTTATSGWRIPLDADPVADTALAIRNLAADIEAGWLNYTPTLTNFSMGTTGSKLIGRYKRRGNTLDWRVLVIGGTGAAATGIMAIGTPAGMVRAGLDDEQVVTGRHFDTINRPSWALVRNGLVVLQSTSTGSWLSTFASGHTVAYQGTIEIV